MWTLYTIEAFLLCQFKLASHLWCALHETWTSRNLEDHVDFTYIKHLENITRKYKFKGLFLWYSSSLQYGTA